MRPKSWGRICSVEVTRDLEEGRFCVAVVEEVSGVVGEDAGRRGWQTSGVHAFPAVFAAGRLKNGSSFSAHS